MKSYGQLCAVARALDVVGDRWTLLIVRELLILGVARYTDLQAGLPGVAPNLLSQRLRDLEAHGVLVREPAPPPASGHGYRLTDRGRDLEGVVRELLKWGGATVGEAPPDAIFQMHWLSMPARYLLRDGRPGDPPLTVRFGDPREGFDATAGTGGPTGVAVQACRPDTTPDATLDGPGPALVGLITGALPLTAAASSGITIVGDPAAVERLLPTPGHRPTEQPGSTSW